MLRTRQSHIATRLEILLAVIQSPLDKRVLKMPLQSIYNVDMAHVPSPRYDYYDRVNDNYNLNIMAAGGGGWGVGGSWHECM